MAIEGSAECKQESTIAAKKRFDLAATENGVFLTVFPSPSGESPVTEPEILAELKANHIDDFSRPILIRIIKEASGKPEKIADLPPVVKEPEIQVIVERDRMEAYVMVVRDKNTRAATVDDIMSKLTNAGVRYGVDSEKVERALLHPGMKSCVATGLRPIDGQDATIKYFFNIENKAKPTENADGSVDYKNLNLFTMVNEGDILAEKIPPVPGKPGLDVLGNVIQPKPGREIPLPLGKNVIAKDNKIVAAIAGQVILANNKVSVAPVLTINGDVDFSSGNIEFNGNVIVKGSVQAGFSIKAAGDVEVHGSVCGAIVEGKNITVRMGIQGMFRGHVKATRTVYARFIENSNVSADEDIIVSDVILHSNVIARRKVIVEGRRGLIAGGRVLAGEEIRAKVAGTQLAIATDLEVGINPSLREEYNTLRTDIRKIEATLDQTLKSLRLLRSMDQSALPPDKREMLLKLTKAQFQLAGQADTMRKRIKEIEYEFDQMRNGKIRLADGVYPGVKIVIGSQIKAIREFQKFVSFYADAGEIKTGSY